MAAIFFGLAFGLAFALLTLVFIGASLDDDGPGADGGQA